MRSYSDGAALRTALEHRLATRSQQSGISIDRLRRRIMFERIVARLDTAEPGLWVLKGGMALEVRLWDQARLTKDIDLGLRESPDVVADVEAFHDRLIDALGVDSDGDFFTFFPAAPRQLLEDGAGHRTWRVRVEARLALRLFGTVSLDISPRSHELDATERLPLPNSLDFAGIPERSVETIDINRHAAEKLHRWPGRWSGRCATGRRCPRWRRLSRTGARMLPGLLLRPNRRLAVAARAGA